MSDESRMVKDPICGKDVDTLRARAVGIFGGVTYYFCSAECKAKYVDPRQGPRQPSAVSHQPSAPAQKQKVVAAEPAEGDGPVRYARSRMRRVTGEVSTPVVNIDLSPNKKPTAPAEAAGEEPLEPARSGRGWAVVAILMLIIAGGVIFFTLKHR
jgi:YHS domain-containing protein